MVPYRYSDYNQLLKEPLWGNKMIIENNHTLHFSVFRESAFSVLEKSTQFIYGNALCYSPFSYATGSLFLIKRNVYLSFPLDSRLRWEEFEDVEWGTRISTAGIPSRINPLSFAQSLSMRPLLLYECSVVYLTSKQIQKRWFPITNWFTKIRKPLFKISETEAWNKLIQFKEKYCPNIPIGVYKLDGIHRLELIVTLIAESEFELNDENVKQYIKDIEKLLLLGSTSYEFREYMHTALMSRGSIAKYDLIYQPEVHNQYMHRPHKGLFPISMTDFFVEHSFFNHIGSWVSSAILTLHNGGVFFNPDGMKGYYKAISNSTPYSEYGPEYDK